MADLSLNWADDLTISVTGDIATVDKNDEVRQRIVRRVLTNAAGTDTLGNPIPPDYVFSPAYGGGLGQYVDRPITSELMNQIQTRLTEQACKEPEVLSNPAPVIKTARSSDGAGLAINGSIYTQFGGVILLPQINIAPAGT